MNDNEAVIDAGVTTDVTVPATTTGGTIAVVAGTTDALDCTSNPDGTTTVHVPADVTADWLPQRSSVAIMSSGVRVGEWPVRVIDATRRAQDEERAAERAAQLANLADAIPTVEAIPGPVGQSLADILRVLTDTP
ncbi:hypothetical protein [Cumulibacter soli]|uniref:hypothetical protein n=1 Tax=Cumulibacter soli TaxID=2546344 RepID=UPI0010677E13|nr:hypothetical protein [Cumulibacter soli]